MTEDTRPESTINEAGDAGPEYIEEYVEVVDNRRRAIALIIALLILLLALGAVTWFLSGSLRPAGAPRGEITEGMVWVASIYGWGSGIEERLQSPSAVAVAPDGSYWTISNNDTLVGFDPRDGRLVGSINLPRGEGDGEIRMLEDVAIDAEGNFFVADYGNAKVLKVLPDGTVDGEVGVSFVQRVAVTSDRLVTGSVPGVAVFGLQDGEFITQWGGRGKGFEEFDGVRGIAIGEDGTIFTTDTFNRRVKAYSPEGRIIWSFPDTETVEAARVLDQLGMNEERREVAEEIPFELPQGMTIDAAGRVVLVDAFKPRISALDPRSGEVLGVWGRDGGLDGQFKYPTAIAYDPVRDQYVVADTGNHRLQVVRIEGSGGSPAAIVARLQGQPVWVCCFPLALLLILIAMAVTRSRRERAALSEDHSLT
ncbi:MAG: NHL repeat-containing protein [Coriobacteriia bacterium]|nr:NHL repeat-containing protein [Coriobacteriia bacterium]